MTRFFKWLQKWIRATHGRHQLRPQRFRSRAIGIGLLTIIPLLLWFQTWMKDPIESRRQWTGRACPPQTPISLFEVKQYPERFHMRRIWLVGRIQIIKKQCFKKDCQGQKNCCSPCQARLAITSHSSQLLLDGWWSPSPRITKRIACRGTSCNLSCEPFTPNQVYAVEGLVRYSSKQLSLRQRVRFHFRYFKVLRYCTPQGPIPKPVYKDPIHKTLRQK